MTTAGSALITIDANKLAAQNAIAKLKQFFEENQELTVLSNQSESLCEQADELKTISTAEQYTSAGELAVSLATVTAEVTAILNPYTEQRKLFNKSMIEIEKSYLEPAEVSRKQLKQAMGSFEQVQEVIRRQEESRQAAIAKQEQEAAALVEAQRLEAEGKTEEAAQVVQEAIEAPAPVVVTPKSYAKVSGVSLRTTWHWKFEENLDKLPEADLRKLISLLIIKDPGDEISCSGIAFCCSRQKHNPC